MSPQGEGLAGLGRTLRQGVGLLLMAGGGMFVVMAIADLLGAGARDTETGVAVALLVLFSGVGYGGALLFRSGRRSARLAARAGAEALERRVLDFARAHDGRVTLAEVAEACDVPVTEAKALLDALTKQGVADLTMTDQGILVYRFSGFLSAAEKAKAV